MTYTNDQLYEFIHKATAATYASGGAYEKVSERPEFLEMTFKSGDWSYRDSYTGFYRSRGMEVIRYQDQPVWTSAYGGGMVKGCEPQASETFNFLKRAMLAKSEDKQSFRGPDCFKEGDWEYRYIQKGDVAQFTGHEEIHFQDKLFFFHDIIGGLVIDK